jgi:Type II secretion system (T2SS), protein E, N-terminal domain
VDVAPVSTDAARGMDAESIGTDTPTGVIAPTGTGRSGFLSDVIVELGFASRETVEQAVRTARSPGSTVARVLIDMGAITEEELARATAERYGIDYVDLSSFEVDPAAANLIKPGVAKRYRAVPVGYAGAGLLVAVADPADALGLSDIGTMTGLHVRPAVAAEPALDALLEELPLAGEGWGRPEPGAAAPGGAAPPSTAAPASAAPGGAAPPSTAGAASAAPGAAAPGAAAPPSAAPGEAAEPQPPTPDPHAEAARLLEERDDLAARLRLAHAEADVRGREFASLRTRLEGAEAELARLRADAETREAELATARRLMVPEGTDEHRLAEELAAADARAEQARQALSELREEGERERERAAMTERELREQLSEEERRRGELETRLSEVETAAFAAERAFEELRHAQGRMRDALRALAEPDAPA